MSPGARLAAAAALLAALAVLDGCSSDPPPDTETIHRALGVQINPPATGGDPILAESYLTVQQGGLAFGQFSFAWGEVEAYAGLRDWARVDLHVAQSRIRALPESAVLLLIDNQTRGSLPADLAGASWDDPNMVYRLVSLVRDLRTRFEGRLEYLWLGREVDAWFATNRSELSSYRKLLAAVRDSLSAEGPLPRVGTVLSYDVAFEEGRLDLGDSLAPAVDRLGLTVYGRDASLHTYLSAGQTLLRIREGSARFAGSTVVVTETAYPGGTGAPPEDQAAFASGLTALLETPPANLEAVAWYSLHDWGAEAAGAEAQRLFAGEPQKIANYTLDLRRTGLREVSGVGKAAWWLIQDWETAASGQPLAAGAGILR